MKCKVCGGDRGPEADRYGCQSCNLSKTDTATDRACRAFDGASKLAEAIGVDRSSITHWRRRGGFIPARKQTAIISAARDRGIELYPADLIQD
jgi:hypothetical protein